MNRPRTGLKRAYNHIVYLLHNPDFFLPRTRGVVHVGGHVAQERQLYAKYGLNVLWIEPIEENFTQLIQGIVAFPKQRALRRLITDVDDQEYPFHVSNNTGASSSILDLGKHKQVWPKVGYIKTLMFKSVTLSTLFKREQIDMSLYDALVMDTQGSELLVLKGAETLLSNFKFIKTEAANFEMYKGGCQLRDLDNFLEGRAFRRIRTVRIKGKMGVGTVYDAVYTSMPEGA
jgi:FkbM family methyltransferase